MPREELVALVRRQDGQIATLSTQVSDLLEANEQLAARLARLEHLLSRNSRNSSMPPSTDDDPGRIPPAEKPARQAGGVKRKRVNSPGWRARTWPGSTSPMTRWTDSRRGAASAA